MPKKFKPCPFCGRQNGNYIGGGDLSYFVHCPRCRARGPTRVSMKGAMDAWDRRKEPEQLDDSVNSRLKELGVYNND